MQRSASWRFAPLLLLGISILDFFVLWIPSDAFLIAALLGNRLRARVFIPAMVLGRMIGTLVAYLIAANAPLEKITAWAMLYHLGGAWEKCQYFFETFGALSLGITALTPFPMLFVVLLSVASRANLFMLLLSALTGSSLRYVLITLGVFGSLKLLNPRAR